MKHKFFTVLLAAALALGTCFGLAACSDNGDEHEHTYTVENKCSVCGEEWEHTPFDAFDFTPVTLNGVEGYDARFGEYKYFEIQWVDGMPIVEKQTCGKPFEGEEVVFPYGYNGLPVISIGRTYACTSDTVKTITIPKSVFSWGIGIMQAGGPSNGSFQCSALEKLSLPDGIPVMTQAVSYSEDPTAVYYLCLETLFKGLGGFDPESCPLYDDPQFRENGALYIGNYLFETDFEETVETFTVRDGTKAIIGCKGAENVIVPDSVETLAAGAFINDQTLKNITLGKGIKVIGENAFSLCSSLTSISIPSGVSEIGDHTFNNCVNLTDIQFAGTMEAWQAIEKGYDWDYSTGNYTVTCTNGTVAKETDAT